MEDEEQNPLTCPGGHVRSLAMYFYEYEESTKETDEADWADLYIDNITGE